MTDLRERAIRGALARVSAQAASLMLRVGSLVVLARLLQPKDFGLVGMVTAFTGVLSLFRDFGLSAATVQCVTVTEEQTSTLFWINTLLGAILTAVSLLLAPLVAAFYHEPRLFWITTILAPGFLFNAIGIQHSALLQRQMRFTALSIIDICSLSVSTGLAIGAAMGGYGYWALVAMTVTLPLISSIGFWSIASWIPGRPRRRAGIRSMVRFGSTITVTGLLVYIASNFEKVLLGRFWGAEAIGLYGRAYQLIRIPTDTLNSAVGEVAFSALSRLQDDAYRLKSYFLKGYSLVLALTLPATLACVLFADDLIAVLLGPKWRDAVPIFRFLAPTILVFAIANPLSWLLGSIGHVGRSLKMSFVITPVMIAAYLIGIPYGPKGVALAYSIAMVLWIVPVVAWSVHNTVISIRDVVTTVGRPLGSSIVASGVALLSKAFLALPSLPMLAIENVILLVVYLGMLLYVMGQRSFYVDVFHKLVNRAPVEEGAVASA